MTDADTDRSRLRVRQLFQFLQAFNEKKNPIQTQISEQRPRWWREFPSHPNLRLAPFEDTSLDDEAATETANVDDFVLKVRRAAVPAPPDLTAPLLGWVVEGWDDPRGQPAPISSRVTSGGVEERFADDPTRGYAFDRWVALRATWAEASTPVYESNLVFHWLFDVHTDMEREAERFELMLGDGLLNWRLAAGGVDFPLLLQRLQLEYDAGLPEFTIAEADRPPDLNASLLRRAGVDGRVVAGLIAEAEKLKVGPLGAERTTGFLRKLAATIAADGEYVEDHRPEGEESHPRISRDTVLFLRSRSQGYAAAISNILEDIETRSDFPDALLSVAGIHNTQDSDADSAIWEQGDEATDVLLSKEANQEQLEIARRLARYGAVTVQGPPGTGKTHTIANLVGHLLSEGKSVLVTSHTAKALRVVREKVVPDLQPLCVTVLEGDSASRDQLSASVAKISARLAAGTRDQLLREALQFKQRRDGLLEQIRGRRLALLSAVSSEYAEVVIGGRAMSTETAARLVAAGVNVDDWIPGPTKDALPLALAEVEALYETNARVSSEDERAIGDRLPELDRVLAPAAFDSGAALLADLIASTRANYRAELWNGVQHDPAQIRLLRDRAAAIGQDLTAAPEWYLAAVASGGGDAAEHRPWTELAALLGDAEQTAQALRIAKLSWGLQLTGSVTPDEALLAIHEVREHVAKGGGLGWLTLKRHSNWRKVIQESSCRGAPPVTTDALDALVTVPTAALAWEKLRQRWQFLMTPLGAEPPGSADGADEARCREVAGLIFEALEFSESVTRLGTAGAAAGLDWKAFSGAFEPRGATAEHWAQLGTTIAREAEEVFGSEIARFERDQVLDAFRTLGRYLKSFPSVGIPDSPLHELLRSVENVDSAGYNEAYRGLVDLVDRSRALDDRRRYLMRLSGSAPDWADAISLRRAPHDGDKPPGDARRAWEWRSVYDELERRCSEDISALISGIETLKTDLRAVTIDLIDRLAWAGQMKRTDPVARQQLRLWLETIKKIGKGSGKNVPRLRRAAQEHMAAAKGAVPVWIAPLSRVAENFDARTTRFDVVIIDEASQCDVMGLIALYLGEKVVVVGDDQQVTPDAVGDRIDTANHLIDTFLKGIPGNHLFDGQYSIYQIAGAAFAGATQLREHFRCVPDIIRFSNALSYNWEILPLRNASDSRVRPAVVSHRVSNGISSEKRNPEEASHVASLMIAACEQPEYADLTFGAISLAGAEQGRLIEVLLRNNMSLAEYERRRILCGTPPQFQGDERHVIFLSVVGGPPDSPPLTSLGDGPREMYKKRYNVAASRARDQLWVVHSLDPARDLKPDDLRWRLLDFARNPRGLKSQIEQAQARAESPLETAVIQRIVTAGYSVTPQFEVGGYRIDLVVGTERLRLAVECDGDRYHTQDDLRRDLERQAQLERLGWKFVRVRGGEFFRNPERALLPLFARLAALGIEPDGGRAPDAEVPADDADADELVERVRSRAAQIRTSWAGRTASFGDPESAPRASGATKAEASRVGRSGAGLETAEAEPPFGRVPTPPPHGRTAPAGPATQINSPTAGRVNAEAARGPTGNPDQRRLEMGSGPAAGALPNSPSAAALEVALRDFANRGFRVDDRRKKGGALWVQDPERKLTEAMKELRTNGLRFQFAKARGGWWL